MPQPNRPGRDVAAEITDLIINKLEEGVPPWSRPWSLSQAGGRPLRHCGTPYTGINTLYLWAIADAEGYRSRYWMTYRQAEALGGNVRRGETGAVSVYYSSFQKHEAHPKTGQDVVLSSALAEALGGPCPSLGRFALRGVAGPEEVFALP